VVVLVLEPFLVVVEQAGLVVVLFVRGLVLLLAGQVIHHFVLHLKEIKAVIKALIPLITAVVVAVELVPLVWTEQAQRAVMEAQAFRVLLVARP
jgi:hypothetical protein